MSENRDFVQKKYICVGVARKYTHLHSVFLGNWFDRDTT